MVETCNIRKTTYKVTKHFVERSIIFGWLLHNYQWCVYFYDNQNPGKKN